MDVGLDRDSQAGAGPHWVEVYKQGYLGRQPDQKHSGALTVLQGPSCPFHLALALPLPLSSQLVPMSPEQDNLTHHTVSQSGAPEICSAGKACLPVSGYLLLPMRPALCHLAGKGDLRHVLPLACLKAFSSPEMETS